MYKNTKLLSVISYITWIGWIIALLLRDRNDDIVRLHLNQALVLNITASLAAILMKIGGIFAFIGVLVNMATFVFAVWGIIRAVQGSREPLPYIGQFQILN